MDDISIILPVFNEKETIEKVLKEWQRTIRNYDFRYHFIICEDGSTDGTTELLHKLIRKYPIILNQKIIRRGYSKAIIDGIHAAKSRFILCIDSDGQCDPRDFHKFWSQKNTADVLIGNRTERIDNRQRKIFSLMFKLFFRFLFPNCVSDPSAPFVLFKKRTIYPYIRYLNFLREGFWWGFVATCLKMNLSIKELPIHHRRRICGDTQVYLLKEIPSIAIRNIFGLIKLSRIK